MNTVIRALATVVGIAAPVALSHGQHTRPPGMTHEEHLAQLKKTADVNTRGAAAMGFEQDKATHHFRLTATGGTIVVDATDRSDDGTRRAIRLHLREIAAAFAKGDFSKPFATHAEVPSGVTEMQRRKNAISYSYEDTPEGGRVRIVSSDRDATPAVHDFLRYQIREHGTGDPLTVTKQQR